MSLRNRVESLARETAIQTAMRLTYTRYQQQVNNNSSIGKVIKAEGVNLTVDMGDGTTKTVVASGTTSVGQGSVGLVINGIFLNP